MNAEETGQKLIDALLLLIAERGWYGFGYGDVVSAVGVESDAARRIFPDRKAIMLSYLGGLERDSLAVDQENADEPVRDRLFAILMERLDLASPHRLAIERLMREGAPKAVWCAGRRWLRQVTKQVGITGMTAPVQTLGLGLVWMTVLPKWFDDDSEDLAPTMAALDSQLEAMGSLWGKIARILPDRVL